MMKFDTEQFIVICLFICLSIVGMVVTTGVTLVSLKALEVELQCNQEVTSE
jgi:hypothetical protein